MPPGTTAQPDFDGFLDIPNDELSRIRLSQFEVAATSISRLSISRLLLDPESRYTPSARATPWRRVGSRLKALPRSL
jgi:hypothetical protein